MDLIGKLTPTENGHQYICVMVDYFTKWSEAYPLKTKKAEEVTGCILDFFYTFGAPQRLLTDQGREFVNKVGLTNQVKINGYYHKKYLNFFFIISKVNFSLRGWASPGVCVLLIIPRQMALLKE